MIIKQNNIFRMIKYMTNLIYIIRRFFQIISVIIKVIKKLKKKQKILFYEKTKCWRLRNKNFKIAEC